MKSRLKKQRSVISMVLGLVLVLPFVTVHSAESIKPILGDDGLYHQSWFLTSFMDLKEDLAEAQAEGKRFAVLWEQKGCPYCRDLHTINFADPKINKYVRENFVVLQLNMWGDREVTDFDGETLPEKAIARKWGVVFTPTMQFFVEESELKAGKGGRDQMVWMMPGYFRKGHFLGSFEFVKERIYEKRHFQKYIGEKLAAESPSGDH